MSRDFKTIAEGAAERAAGAEAKVEALKRGVENCLHENRYERRGALGLYLKEIGVKLRISPGAGIEFEIEDMQETAHGIDITPMPDILRRYMKD